MICAQCGHENPETNKFCGECAAPLSAGAGSPREVRKTVTILFCDVVGSTELGERLDPEVLRSTLAGYFDVAEPVIERHGGTVEKFIGDAVMAVFGLPQVHEDDAIRAVRAAAELREALRDLDVSVRLGVATGEAVTGSGQTLGSGNVFNLAARLQTAASVGEVLISDATFQLVRDAVRVEAVPPLRLKGKRQAVTAWNLREVRAGEPGYRRAFDGPLIGRGRELLLLEGASERCRAEGRCHLVTILGSAGIGKSRLTAELANRLGIRTAVGRCLPYGDGITYLPLVEIVQRLAGERPAAEWLRETLAAQVDAPRVFDAAATALGLPGTASGSEGEIPWAVRRSLESAAGDALLMVVFDDIQWAEPSLLDVIEHIVDWSRSTPILVVCIARTEFLESRPEWGGGKVNSTMLLLEPLSAQQSQEQVDALADADSLAVDVRRQIVETAGGNPLFAEQIVALLEQGPVEESMIPASVQALLAARVDALGSTERALLEAAAVEGQVFHRDAVAALVGGPAGGDVERDLRALTRQELIEPQSASDIRGAVYVFRHLLIRDAAYDAISLARRADLHEQFGDWLEVIPGDGASQYQAILGYHLDTACRCREQLGASPQELGGLGARAGAALAEAGQLAWRQWDGAFAPLLERSLVLLPPGHPARLRTLLVAARSAFHGLGRIDRMSELIDLGLAEAASAGDEAMRLRFELARTEYETWHGHDLPIEPRRRQAEAAIQVFDRLDDTDGTVQALGLLSVTEQDAMQGERTRAVAERLLAIGARTGDTLALDAAATTLSLALLDGPTPTNQAIARSEELVATTAGPGRASAMQYLAEMLGACGEFDRARSMLREAERISAPLGSPMVSQGYGWTEGAIEMLAGQWIAAETALRRIYDALLGSDEGWTIAGVGDPSGRGAARAGAYRGSTRAGRNIPNPRRREVKLFPGMVATGHGPSRRPPRRPRARRGVDPGSSGANRELGLAVLQGRNRDRARRSLALHGPERGGGRGRRTGSATLRAQASRRGDPASSHVPRVGGLTLQGQRVARRVADAARRL